MQSERRRRILLSVCCADKVARGLWVPVYLASILYCVSRSAGPFGGGGVLSKKIVPALRTQLYIYIIDVAQLILRVRGKQVTEV